jgi:gamma-glutamyltranspeptidase/glutathione hydrolase
MADSLKDLGEEYIPGEGPLGVSVPGAVKGWCDLHDRFGKLPWARLFDSAIGYAKDGHPVAQVIAAEWYIPGITGCPSFNKIKSSTSAHSKKTEQTA